MHGYGSNPVKDAVVTSQSREKHHANEKEVHIRSLLRPRRRLAERNETKDDKQKSAST